MTPGECSDIVVRTADGLWCPYQPTRCRLEAIIFISLIMNIFEKEARKPDTIV